MDKLKTKDTSRALSDDKNTEKQNNAACLSKEDERLVVKEPCPSDTGAPHGHFTRSGAYTRRAGSRPPAGLALDVPPTTTMVLPAQ